MYPLDAASRLPRLVSLLLITALVVGGGFLLAGPGEVAKAPSVPALLPAHTLAYLQLDAGPLSRFGKQLALSRIMEEPQVVAFLEQALSAGDMLAEDVLLGLEQDLGISPEDLQKLGDLRVTLALTGLRTVERTYGDFVDQDVVPDLALTVEAPDGADVLQTLLAVGEQMIAERGFDFEALEVEGTPVKKLHVEDAGLDVLYTVLGGRVVICTSEELLASMLRRARGEEAETSLAARGSYASTMAAVSRPTSVIQLWLDYAGLMQLVLSEMPEGGEKAWNAVGMQGVRGMSYGMDIDGPGLRDRFFVDVEPGGALAEMYGPPGPMQSLRMAPDSTVLYGAYRLDPARIWDYMAGVMAATEPGAEEFTAEILEQAKQMTGLDLRDELLPVLGPEIALYAALPGQALIPDAALMLQVQDEARIRTAIMNLLARAGTRLQVRSTDFLGQRIDYLEIRGSRLGGGRSPRMNLRPSWSFVDGFLVVSLWPQTIKNLVANGRRQGGVLAANTDFSGTAARLRQGHPEAQELFVGYADLTRFVGFLLDNGVPFLQSLVPPNESVPLDWAAFPTSDSFTRHLFGLVATAGVQEGGFYCDAYSPTGFMLPYMAGIGAMVAAFSVRDSAMRGMIEVEPIELLPVEEEETEEIRPEEEGPKPAPRPTGGGR